MGTCFFRESDHDKTAVLAIGERIEIDLAENPTTGYRWAVNKLDKAILDLENSTIELDSALRAGSGGRRKLVFAARASGRTTIELKLWREWEGDASIRERFVMTAVVRSSSNQVAIPG